MEIYQGVDYRFNALRIATYRQIERGDLFFERFDFFGIGGVDHARPVQLVQPVRKAASKSA
jgi:hypothetical protein